MNKENERITYEEFMTMFKFAPRMCYTLYVKAEDEIENLQKEAELADHYKHLYSEVKKQKDDGIKYIRENVYIDYYGMSLFREKDGVDKLLRMLGEIDVED